MSQWPHLKYKSCAASGYHMDNRDVELFHYHREFFGAAPLLNNIVSFEEFEFMLEQKLKLPHAKRIQINTRIFYSSL